MQTFKGHKRRVNAIISSPIKPEIVTCGMSCHDCLTLKGEDSKIIRWDVYTAKEIQTYLSGAKEEYPARSVCISEDNELLLGNVYLLDINAKGLKENMSISGTWNQGNFWEK